MGALRAAGRARRQELDQEVLGMARGGGLNLIGAIFSQLALFAISILLARRLGSADVGIYFQAFAFLSLLNLLALSGFRAGMTRFVALHRADNDPGAIRGTVRLGLGLTTAFSVVLGVVLYVVAPWLVVHAFHDPGLLAPLRLVALILPLSTFTDTALAATQGFKTQKPFTLIGRIFEPALRIGITITLLVAGRGLMGAMWSLLVSNASAAVLAGWSLRCRMGRPTATPVYRPRELFSFSTVSWFASLASTGLIWADTIILGIYLPSAEVGVYNVATRLVVLATFVMAPINAVFGPHIADLYQRRRTETLRDTYGVATSWIVRLSLPAFILVILFPSQLLELFGSGFAVGATVTVILAVGKLIDAATGPCGLMLNMTGRPMFSMMNNVAVLVLNVGLNVWLIPRYGILGSAIAWAVALGLVNFIRVLQVRVIMAMLPFDAGVLKGIVAGAAAFVAGFAARLWAPPSLALFAGAVVVGVVYLGSILLLGLTSEDRLILQTFTRRLRLKRA